MENMSFSIFPNDNFLDLRLYQYGWEQCAPLHSFGPFVRNHYLFHYILSGQGVLHSDDGDGVTHHYYLGPGRGFLICPGQVNTYSADEKTPWKYTWVEFDGLRAAEYLEAAGLGVNQPLYEPRDLRLGAAVGERLLYIADHADASPLHLVGQLCLFLDQLISSSSTRREIRGGQLRDFYIQEAVCYIKQNYPYPITDEEIANACKLNRSYFSKLFKEIIGSTPQEFLINLRLSEAAEQMKTTSASIGDIAVRCGYPNQLHFSQAFKKRYGLPPREWRKSNQTVKAAHMKKSEHALRDTGKD